MSTSVASSPKPALTRTLDHWLDEGPTSAPDLTVEAALRTVATTRQRQLRGRLLRMADFHGPVVPVSLTLAGITAVVLVAIGLGLNNEPVPGVEDSPPPGVATEEPVPTDIPYGYVMFRNEADGYEIALPRAWEVRSSPHTASHTLGVTRFGSGDEESPAFGGERRYHERDRLPLPAPRMLIRRSLDRWTKSRTRSNQSGRSRASSGGCPSTNGSSAPRSAGSRRGSGIRQAQRGRTIMGFTTTCTAYALHAGRPVILSFPCGRYFTRNQDGAEPATLEQLNAIIASFRFLDDPAPSGPAEASNPPYVQSGLELFRNEGDAYEVLVPEAWDLAVEPVYGEPRGVSRFVGYVSGFEGQSSSLPSPLVISVGSPDGSLYLCQSRACRQVVVRNPADLESKIEEHLAPRWGGVRRADLGDDLQHPPGRGNGSRPVSDHQPHGNGRFVHVAPLLGLCLPRQPTDSPDI